MIYVIGDSFTYGHNFIDMPDRVSKIYSTHLGKLLDKDVKNLSVPGSSNWRIARVISALELSKEDVVVINWTDSMRLELGNSNKQLFTTKGAKSPMIFDYENLGNANNPSRVESNLNFLEKHNGVYYRRIAPSLFTIEDDEILDKSFLEMCKLLYSSYMSEDWCEDMFLIMFQAVVYKLRTSKCKFVMFNSWNNPYKKTNLMLDIPEYMLGYQNNMCKYLRGQDVLPIKISNFEKNKDYKDIYWTIDEHNKIADILHEFIKGQI